MSIFSVLFGANDRAQTPKLEADVSLDNGHRRVHLPFDNKVQCASANGNQQGAPLALLDTVVGISLSEQIRVRYP